MGWYEAINRSSNFRADYSFYIRPLGRSFYTFSGSGCGERELALRKSTRDRDFIFLNSDIGNCP
ncbi:MAG: hypothetical protein WBB29_10365 [Geitlerinemataceae cyanobacterium]